MLSPLCADLIPLQSNLAQRKLRQIVHSTPLDQEKLHISFTFIGGKSRFEKIHMADKTCKRKIMWGAIKRVLKIGYNIGMISHHSS